jgi:hypothetical protein
MADPPSCRRRALRATALVLGVALAGCVHIGEDPCSSYNLGPGGSLYGSKIFCDGNVLVTQPTKCDSGSGSYVPDGPPSRENCAALANGICLEGRCEVTCHVDPDCGTDQYCSDVILADGSHLCRDRLQRYQVCDPDASLCRAGLVCEGSPSTAERDSGFDARPDANATGDGAQEDSGGTTASPPYTCEPAQQ